jgi:hypothetical protein
MDSDGKIGRQTSSKKYKDNITSMESIDWLYNLNPVNFIYKKDKTKSKQYGLIAEEVDIVNKSIVVYKEDEPDSVSYDKLITPLLKSVQEQKKEIDNLKAEIEELKKK